MSEPGEEEEDSDRYDSFFGYRFLRYGGVPTEVEDFLWYKPGGKLGTQTLNPNYNVHCRKCDVFGVVRPEAASQARCWCCGRFMRLPDQHGTTFRNYGTDRYSNSINDATQRRINQYTAELRRTQPRGF